MQTTMSSIRRIWTPLSSSNQNSYDSDQPSLTAHLCSHDMPEWRLRRSEIASLRRIGTRLRAGTGTKRSQISSSWGPNRSDRQVGRKRERKLRVTCRLGKGCCRHNSLASHRPAAAETRQEPTLLRRAHRQRFTPDALLAALSLDRVLNLSPLDFPAFRA